MYATRGDLRQHVTKVHRCGIYAKMPAGGLSIRQRSYSSSLKNAQRLSGSSNSPIKQQQRRRETVYRCSMCESKFPHVRAIERHLYDVHHIDPFDTEAMKNATIPGEEEVDDADEQQQHEDTSLELNSSRRDEDEQMAIIQFRNQSQSPLIVKIERGASVEPFVLFRFHRSLSDGYDDFETADDFLANKPTPRARQLQKARRTPSKHSFDDSSAYLDARKDLGPASHDDEMNYDNEHEMETGDPLVEMIDDDDDSFIDDDDTKTIIKYRSSTHKLT